MTDTLYLAWCYLAHHRLKTIVLVGAVTVVLALPAGLRVLLDRSAEALTVRAEATPLLVGAKGSPLELVLDSLYFESDTPAPMNWAEVDRVTQSELAMPIPLHTRFTARDHPIVGTSPEYFGFRELEVATGRGFAILGECVLGAGAARELGLAPGDKLVSSPETVFDLAGVYPLAMKIVGVLAPTGGPDDHAVFADVKTTWVIAGLAHGHQDMASPEAATGVLSREGDVIIANASVREYTEITADNIDSFHFHGDLSEYPVTAVIAVPHDQKAATLLEGRYLGEDEQVQIVHPSRVMDKLLATVLTVRRYVTAAVIGVGLATVATMALVFVLSIQARRREIETLVKLGCPRHRLLATLATEIGGVLVLGVGLAVGAATILWWFGDEAVRLVVQLLA